MSLQGPIVVIGEQQFPALIDAISAAGAFPVIESSCADAAAAIAAAHPSAIVLADAQATADDRLASWLTREVTRQAPIVPVVACGNAQAAPAYPESLAMTQGCDPQAIAARIASGVTLVFGVSLVFGAARVSMCSTKASLLPATSTRPTRRA